MTLQWRRQILPLVLSVLFVIAGGTKVAGLDFQIESFGRWRFPAWWFMHAVGVAELLGAGLLVFARSRAYGASLLLVLMLSAISTHLRVGEFLVIPAPLILTVLLLLVLRMTLRQQGEDSLPGT